jgi:hypothetical protein
MVRLSIFEIEKNELWNEEYVEIRRESEVGKIIGV